MIKNLLIRSLKITLIIQVVLIIYFVTGFIINSEKYGKHYIREAIYFNFLFLQFLPLIYLVVLVICSTCSFILKENKQG
jgi:hypothetical protein